VGGGVRIGDGVICNQSNNIVENWRQILKTKHFCGTTRERERNLISICTCTLRDLELKGLVV
jgi:hypothetical protein